MKSLKEVLNESIKSLNQTYDRDWDGHIHLFNHKEPLPQKPDFDKYVGFMDLEYDDITNINVLDSYTDYIKNHWDKNKEILLATGITIDDIISIHKKYPDIIKGFGELKCYDLYKGIKVPYKKIGFVRDVVRYSSKNGNLPVYIHWELNNSTDVKKLEGVIKSYPSVPIILCHLGMNENNRDIAFVEAMRLQKQYSNVWLDISWDAAEYLLDNLMRLNNLDLNRVILGTDLNNKLFGDNHTKEDREWGLEAFANLKEYLRINNKSRLQSLFGKEPK